MTDRVVRVLAIAVLAAAVAALAGCRTGGAGAVSSARDEQASTNTTVSVPPGVRDFRSTRTLPSAPPPRRLRIPVLGVDTTLERLGSTADRAVEVPRDWQRAGWYRDGPRPGEPGSAVILGHVDSPYGPAVFSGVAGLKPGARLLVDRSDGSTVTFRVTRVALYQRSRFPVEQVYLPTLDRELRLITCGGRYIASRGGYQSNVVVFASAQ